MGTQSESIYGFIIPLILYSTNIDSPDALYLFEEGLELWQYTLQNATKISNELLSLFGNIAVIIEREDFENIVTVLKITDSYTLLGKEQFLQAHGKTLNSVFVGTVGKLKDKGTLLCVNALETLLILFPVQSAQFFQQPLTRILTDIVKGHGSPLVLSSYICLFARILFASREVFSSYAQTVQNALGGNVLISFVDMWLKMADHVISALKRKIGALSLLTLYPTDNALLLERFGAVVNLCVQVLYEVDEVNHELHKRISEKPATGPENEFEGGWSFGDAEEEPLDDDDEEPITEEHEYGRKRMVSLKIYS